MLGIVGVTRSFCYRDVASNALALSITLTNFVLMEHGLCMYRKKKLPGAQKNFGFSIDLKGSRSIYSLSKI
jgi:hypothetical protein